MRRDWKFGSVRTGGTPTLSLPWSLANTQVSYSADAVTEVKGSDENDGHPVTNSAVLYLRADARKHNQSDEKDAKHSDHQYPDPPDSRHLDTYASWTSDNKQTLVQQVQFIKSSSTEHWKSFLEFWYQNLETSGTDGPAKIMDNNTGCFHNFHWQTKLWSTELRPCIFNKIKDSKIFRENIWHETCE